MLTPSDSDSSMDDDEHEVQDEPVWRHHDPKSTQIYEFVQTINQQLGLHISTYTELHEWSVTQPAAFWRAMFTLAQIEGECTSDQVLNETDHMFPRPNFFPDCKLNFAQNLLHPPSDPKPDDEAIIGVSEDQPRETVTWAQLRDRVRRCANGLKEHDIGDGDCVAGIVANHAQAVVCMLATTALGAIWTGISPDTGVSAITDRLQQVKPRVIFFDNGTRYKGKVYSTFEKMLAVCKFPVFEHTIVIELHTIPGCELMPEEREQFEVGLTMDYGCLELLPGSPNMTTPLEFKRFPSSHPIYILYSSGTTGAPKPIVHSSLGTLLQHRKEHVLHCDIRPDDRLFYYTTTTWMMWHWLISGLASGACLVLYDGAPGHPHGNMTMFYLLEDLKINHFGTSAKYLSTLEQAALAPWSYESTKPLATAFLSSLRTIFSTGSPLAPSTYHYVYDTFVHPKAKMPPMLASITGGTDILSLFLGPVPLDPVYAGEIQAPCLGMSTRVYSVSDDDVVTDVTLSGEQGELVCTVPFPAQPVFFLPEGEEGDEKYRSAYFDTFEHVDHPGVDRWIWHHGDYVQRNLRTGGWKMLGRSDGVLKPAGVRFGSSEIYNILLKFFAAEVEDSICVGRRRPGIDDDETVCLFLQMRDHLELDQPLRDKIKDCIASELSRRHVPRLITEVNGIPVTANGKKVEGVVRSIVNEQEEKGNGKGIKRGAVVNEVCLEDYRAIARELDGKW